MSVLVIQLPARTRLPARQGADALASGALSSSLSEIDHVLSSDGLSVAAAGRAAPALLPRADTAVVVLADADVAWHRIPLPRAPASKLRAALAGVLEEVLLDDDGAVHLALQPQAAAGQPAWVAAVDRAWLVAALAAIEGAGTVVDRVVPSSLPGGDSAHFFSDRSGDDTPPLLALPRDDGVAVLRSGALARSLLPAELSALRWTATPQAAAAAEHWLGAPVAVLSDAERALAAAASGWNLRQFDLAPQRRGTLAARDAWRRIKSPEWRPARWGMAALVAAQLAGLNLEAWRQQRAVDDRRAEMGALLKTAYPNVRALTDQPLLQMQRETDLLRAVAGRPGDSDLDVLLGAAAAAWPDGQGPVQTLRFESGRLTLAAPGWGEPQIAQFRDRLRPAGYAVEVADGRVTLQRESRSAG